ncbi:MAG: VWA domain-containing protein [Desulfurococcaceae archaeon]|nr:VWA domain-containing protein [Sulfolobales archaeon]MDW8170715.1 VWA domain-containing protein [Desulfurococcaceae archaeon]
MSATSIEGSLRGVNYDSALTKYRGLRVLNICKAIAEGVSSPIINPVVGIDTYYTLFLPYPLLKPFNEVRGESAELSYTVVTAMLAHPALHKVKSLTVGDSFTSSIASGIMLSQLAKEFSKKLDALRNSMLQRSRENAWRRTIEEAVERSIVKVSEDLEAVVKVKRYIEEAAAGKGSSLSLEEHAEEVIRLAKNSDVRRLLEVLMKTRPWSTSVKKQKYACRRGELSGYSLGKDIERLVPKMHALPSEIFLHKFIEGRLLLYEKRLAKELGPIYCLIDKSGSMNGMKITWAKAVAIGLYLRAIRETRCFYLRFFDSEVHQLMKASSGKASEAIKILDYLSRVRSSGGTDITKAILIALSDLRRTTHKGLSEVVLITDGVDRVDELRIHRGLKAANARLLAVMILGDNASLKKVSSNYFTVVKLSKEEALRVVELK